MATLTLAEAEQILAAAKTKMNSLGVKLSVSVVDPPAMPTLRRPPFLGVAAQAVAPKSWLAATAETPTAEARAKKSRRLIFF